MGKLPIKGDYTPHWADTAFMVKAEAGNACVRCGRIHHVDSGYVLTVHHFDGDKGNDARWNLMALCHRCHLSVQARVDPNTPLMFDPSPWSMPYIAGFYEAGRGIPGPTYSLGEWIEEYERTIGAWPAWAPRPTGTEVRDG